MRCYIVKAIGLDGRTKGYRYAGTSADSRTTRERLMATFGLKKKDVSIDPAEIPTAKAELLDFINRLLVNQDATV